MRLTAVAAVAAVVLAGLWWVWGPEPDANELSARFAPLSVAHPLGTDHLGRDLLSRLVHGAQLSLGLSAVALVASVMLGSVVGGLASRRGGLVATALLVTVDTVGAIPTVVIALVITAAAGPGVASLFASILVATWAPHARLAYQLTTKIAAADFVEAASAVGARPAHVLRRHIWPNAARPLLAHAVLGFPTVLLTVAGLSFLGLGAQPPRAEWGAMLSDAQPYLERFPLGVVAPASCIVAAGLVVAALGRRLEQAVVEPSRRRTAHDTA